MGVTMARWLRGSSMKKACAVVAQLSDLYGRVHEYYHMASESPKDTYPNRLDITGGIFIWTDFIYYYSS